MCVSDHLTSMLFWASTDNMPKLSGQPVDLLGLYREVGLRGGEKAVQDRKWWKRIGASFALHLPCSIPRAYALDMHQYWRLSSCKDRNGWTSYSRPCSSTPCVKPCYSGGGVVAAAAPGGRAVALAAVCGSCCCCGIVNIQDLMCTNSLWFVHTTVLLSCVCEAPLACIPA